MSEKTIKKADDYTANKILLVFSAALVFMLLMMVFQRTCFTTIAAWRVGLNIAEYGFYAALAGVGASLALWIFRSFKKSGKTRPLVTPADLLVAFVIPAICLGSIRWILADRTFRYFYVLIPLLAVLYIVYHIYQRDFFVFTLLSGVGGLSFYALYASDQQTKYEMLSKILGIGGIVLFLLALFVMLYLHGTGGTFKSYRVFPARTNYLPHFILCGSSIAGFVLTLILGATAAFIMVFAVAALLLVCAVYYTVRLI